MISKTEIGQKLPRRQKLADMSAAVKYFFDLNKSFFENPKLKVFRNETIVEMILTCENK